MSSYDRVRITQRNVSPKDTAVGVPVNPDMRPEREVVVVCMATETGSDSKTAELTLRWIDGILQQIRRHNYMATALSGTQTDTQWYALFSQIMPADTPITPDSAADLICRYLLVGTETRLVHTRSSRGPFIIQILDGRAI